MAGTETIGRGRCATGLVLLAAIGILFAATLGLEAAPQPADNPRPLATARVGDWAQYHMVTRVGKTVLTESIRKDRVIRKTDKEITLEATVTTGGQESKSTLTLKLDEPYMPESQFNLTVGGAADAKFKEIRRGRETLRVSGRRLRTSWTLYDITVKAMGRDSKLTSQLWRCDEVPLGGMVRIHTLSADRASFVVKQEIRLTGFGRGPKVAAAPKKR